MNQFLEESSHYEEVAAAVDRLVEGKNLTAKDEKLFAKKSTHLRDLLKETKKKVEGSRDKLITAMLWTIISSVVIGLCVLMFVGLSTAASGDGRQLFAQISDALRQMFALFNTQSALIVFEAVLCVLVMLAFSILHIYLALVIGGVVSHRHKVLAGIGFYFVISIVVSILTAIAQYYFGSSLIGGINGMGSVIFNPQNEIEAANQLVSAAQPYYWFSIGFTAALDVGCFYLSKYFLEKKLNLE